MNWSIISLGIDIFTILICIVVSITDIRSYRIPDIVVLPAILIVLAVTILNNPTSFAFRIIEPLIWCGLLLVIRSVMKGKMGIGDIKLIGLIVLAFGTFASAIAVGIATFTAIGWFMLHSARNRGKAREEKTAPIPFAPFLTLGGIAAFLLDLVLAFPTLSELLVV